MAKAYDRDEGGAAGCAKMGYVGLPPESRRSSYFARQSAWGRVLTFANDASRPGAALRPCSYLMLLCQFYCGTIRQIFDAVI
jgi:hypothetical protein